MKLKKTKKIVANSFDKLHQVVITEDENIFDLMLELSDIIIRNTPVLAIFSNVSDEVKATHVLGFLSGVTYALDGSVYSISNETYLFASKEALKDGSLNQYLNEVVVR